MVRKELHPEFTVPVGECARASAPLQHHLSGWCKDILGSLDALKTEVIESLSTALFPQCALAPCWGGRALLSSSSLLAQPSAAHWQECGLLFHSSLLSDLKPSASVEPDSPVQRALALMLVNLMAVLAALISYFRLHADSQRHPYASFTQSYPINR